MAEYFFQVLYAGLLIVIAFGIKELNKQIKTVIELLKKNHSKE
ncbi:hypothetical protein ABE354_07425 [Brevibacillus laterosporus]